MLGRALTAAVPCLLWLCAAAPAQADDLYCDLAAPPANAVPAEDLGHTIFIFPDALPANFTGCKTWWIETGQKYLMFRLKDGRVTETTMLQEKSGNSMVCRYPDGALAKDAPDGCMGFANAQAFAEHAMGPADAPDVPPAKDVRTKDPL